MLYIFTLLVVSITLIICYIYVFNILSVKKNKGQPVKTFVSLIMGASSFNYWCQNDLPLIFLTGYNFDFLLGHPINKKEYTYFKEFNKLFEATNNKLKIYYYLVEEISEEHIEVLFGKDGIKPEYKSNIEFRILKPIDNLQINENHDDKDLIVQYKEFLKKLEISHFGLNYSINKNKSKDFFSLLVELEHLPREQYVKKLKTYENIYTLNNYRYYIDLVNYIENNPKLYKVINFELPLNKVA